MPKAMSFNPNSVIYFQGDIGDRVFILKAGRVSLNSRDIETGEEVHDLIQTGEFFGVKSALGKYPREENAVVLSEAQVVVFSVPEFEQLVSNNTRIIMKMLKVFSNQLRRIHGKVSSLLNTGNQTDPEAGLFQIGEYYMRKKDYTHGSHAFRRYLEIYPSGAYADPAREYLKKAEEFLGKYGDGQGPGASSVGGTSAKSSATRAGKELNDEEKRYYKAVSLQSKEQYKEALEEFQQLAKEAVSEEMQIKSMYEIGRCLFFLNQYNATVKHFSNLLQKYPRIGEINDILFYIGKSYHEAGESERARTFYARALSMGSPSQAITRKVNAELRKLS
ncbi:MAG: cyclic nucleotide-binding domain-containing protein [Alkalispirochaetaceae bacterium]